MQLVARTLRFLATRYLADPRRPNQTRPNQHIARANAAQASATFRQRRHEQDEVDTYLRGERAAHLRAAEVGIDEPDAGLR